MGPKALQNVVMDLLLFDFAGPRAIDTRTVIYDRVLGGISHSRLRGDPKQFKLSLFVDDALNSAPALDPARICQAGLMIAARQAGLFTLEVRRISLT